MMRLELKKSLITVTVLGVTTMTSSAAFADVAPTGPFESCGCSTVYQTGGESFPAMAVVMLIIFALVLCIWGWRHRTSV